MTRTFFSSLTAMAESGHQGLGASEIHTVDDFPGIFQSALVALVQVCPSRRLGGFGYAFVKPLGELGGELGLGDIRMTAYDCTWLPLAHGTKRCDWDCDWNPVEVSSAVRDFVIDLGLIFLQGMATLHMQLQLSEI